MQKTELGPAIPIAIRNRSIVNLENLLDKAKQAGIIESDAEMVITVMRHIYDAELEKRG